MHTISPSTLRRVSFSLGLIALLVVGFLFLHRDLTQAQKRNLRTPVEFTPVEPAMTGTITGRVFRDYNGDGVYDTSGGTAAAPLAVDAGVAGVAVTAYDGAGATSGTATTAADGAYNLAASGTGPYRIEFTNLPTGYKPSARSTDSVSGGTASNSGSTVQFVPDGATGNVNLALNRPVDYCENNPLICSQLYGIGAPNQPEALFTVPFTGGSTRTTGGAPVTDFTSPGNTSWATIDQVGTTFGLAYNRDANTVYAAAFMKKHARLGPGGTGAIYQLNLGTGAVSEYVNLNTVFGANTAGANPHNAADYDIDNGQTTWNAVGKVALGGMAISDDMAHLFVVNLADRRLYKIPTSGPLSNATITSAAYPSTFTDCSNAANVRPFAVTYHEGQLYLGVLCSAEGGPGPSNRLRMYVLQANPSTLVINATPLFNERLNYSRSEVDPGAPAEWNDWTAAFTNLANQGNFIFPQPMLTDIDFDGGDMIISLRDRMGDQTGYFNRSDPSNTNDLRKGITAGDTLRACGTLGSWTLESNGRCGGVGNAPQNTGEGPGNGEYYHQDSYHPNGNPHDEVSNGAAHQIPGQRVLVSSMMDPVYIPNDDIYDSGGFRWLVNSTGAQNRGYLAYAAGDFGKANGMGNVIALCTAAPIEIGNRIWNDMNVNGVQDPGEAGIAGVTVRLYRTGSLMGTAVTDANGEYYFVSSTVADPNTADHIGQVSGGVLASTAYEVRLDNTADYLVGGPLYGRTVTTVNQTSQSGLDDSSDSDATLVSNPSGSPSGTFPVIAVTTGTAGSNDHTFDIGVMTAPTAAPISVDGRVMTASGAGIRNVRVTLTLADGSQQTTYTGTFGYYRFTGIDAGGVGFIDVAAKRYTFPVSSLMVDFGDSVTGLNFHANQF